MLLGKSRSSKILCYVLIFDQHAIIKKSLDFLVKYADRLDLVVIENPSLETPLISKMIEEYGRQGLIKRYYQFDQNITGMAYDLVITKEIRSIKKTPLVLITDGDLTCQTKSWLDEEINILDKHSDVFACGVSLEMSNLPLRAFPEAKGWIPADIETYEDFHEACTGGHLLLMRGKGLFGFMRWKQKNKIHFLDSNMHRYCYQELHKKWARTKHSKAYHLTWDLYQDKNHPYTKLKSDKSFDETWRHQNRASYTLTEY